MKKTAVIICIIISAAIFAGVAGGCGSTVNTDDNVLAGINTYASGDVSCIEKLADYKNIVITKDLTVTEDDVAEKYLESVSSISERNDFTADPPEIDEIYAELVALVPAGTECQKGDIICFDYNGRTEEGPLSGGVAHFVLTMLGAGHFIPGFEESIIGHKTGETFDITVTFPDSYPQNRDLENKEVVFEILVHHIIPPISDESVRLLSEHEKREFDEIKTNESDEFKPSYSGAEEYRTYITEKLRQDLAQSFDQNLESTVMYKLYTETEFGELPQNEIDSFKKSVEEAAASYGISTEVYLYYAYGGMSTEEEFNELARYQVATKAIMSAICQNENYTLSKAEFDEKAALIAANYEYGSAEELIEDAGIENVCNSIIVEFVLDLLKENTTIETV